MQTIKGIFSRHSTHSSTPTPTSPPVDGLLHVPHIRQQAEWDCGLACALSLLHHFGHTSMTLSELHRLVGGVCSVWSIDLVLLLHSFHLSLSFSSTTLGVNPSHSSSAYYTHDLPLDLPRITAHFVTAAARGIPLLCQSIPPAAFLALLPPSPSPHLLLLLVNPALLHCPRCSRWGGMGIGMGEGGAGLGGIGRGGFTGHFVVVVGVERRRGRGGVAVDVVRYMDPASECDECEVGATWMEQARKAQGTDEDCIIISTHNNTTTTTSSIQPP